jgi:hypothetical protein
MWRLLSRVRYSVTEESRLQSILAISVVSTKNSSLRSQYNFDHGHAIPRVRPSHGIYETVHCSSVMPAQRLRDFFDGRADQSTMASEC